VTELTFRKRRAKHAGEVGLFMDSAAFQEEWESVKLDSEVEGNFTTTAVARYSRFFHALCGKVADNIEGQDKDSLKDELLIKCHHVTYHFDKLRGKVEIKPKTTRNLDGDKWLRLIRRATYIVLTDYLPGMNEGELRDGIEQMIGVTS
jgi:hypothetical protein